MNIEIYNYLNLINFKLAKLYKNGLYNPFPVNFEVTEADFKERLFFSQIQSKLPNFIFEEKKKIKKYFKNSKKNIKKILKNLKKSEFLSNFDKKFENYLNLRLKLTKCLIHDFKNQSFDESDAIEQVYKLNPIFADLLFDLFNSDCDIEKMIFDIEDKYNLTYAEKIKLIEKKNNQKSKKISIELNKKTVEKSKSAEKTSKTKQKTKINQEKSIEKEKTSTPKTKTTAKKTTTKNKEI